MLLLGDNLCCAYLAFLLSLALSFFTVEAQNPAGRANPARKRDLILAAATNTSLLSM